MSITLLQERGEMQWMYINILFEMSELQVIVSNLSREQAVQHAAVRHMGCSANICIHLVLAVPTINVWGLSWLLTLQSRLNNVFWPHVGAIPQGGFRACDGRHAGVAPVCARPRLDGMSSGWVSFSVHRLVHCSLVLSQSDKGCT
jgi:hypothetical protein